jgi:transposase
VQRQVAKLNKAIDEVRASEAKRMVHDGYEPLLKHSRWCLLKNPSNLTAKQNDKLTALLQYNPKIARAYLLKEERQLRWEHAYPAAAGTFFYRWCTKALRSRIEPMQQMAPTIRGHQDLILNWFRARGMISGGAVEGPNNKRQVTVRRYSGFRTFRVTEVALYHALGKLPEPAYAHRFF